LKHLFIQEAIKKIDYGEYGECVRCGEDINEKPLVAVPWAAMCIRCQEEISLLQIIKIQKPNALSVKK
jgi:RNA polymerase-binding transcription factor DksA